MIINVVNGYQSYRLSMIINMICNWRLSRWQLVWNDWIWRLKGLRLLVEGKGFGIGAVGHGGGEGYVTVRRTGACCLEGANAMLVHYGVGRGKTWLGLAPVGV